MRAATALGMAASTLFGYVFNWSRRVVTRWFHLNDTLGARIPGCNLVN
jgi:hypothetical protein